MRGPTRTCRRSSETCEPGQRRRDGGRTTSRSPSWEFPRRRRCRTNTGSWESNGRSSLCRLQGRTKCCRSWTTMLPLSRRSRNHFPVQYGRHWIEGVLVQGAITWTQLPAACAPLWGPCTAGEERTMTHPFDPGYGTEPFRTPCADYPGADVLSRRLARPESLPSASGFRSMGRRGYGGYQCLGLGAPALTVCLQALRE